jgi:hypothetical protein
MSALVALVALFVMQPAGAAYFSWPSSAGYNPEFPAALWAEGPFTEIYSTFTVPVLPTPAASALAVWIGIGGAAQLIQAGAITTVSEGIEQGFCYWQNPPDSAFIQEVMSGVACNPGDVIYVDIAVDQNGPNESQITIVDWTTWQIVHLEAYTPDHVDDLIGYTQVESTPAIGNAPASFAPITFSGTELFTGGYWYNGGRSWSLWDFAWCGYDFPFNTLTPNVIPGTTVGLVTSVNVGTVTG